MKKDNSRILLVEGESDRGFFEQVCKRFNLNPTINVAVPKDLQGNTRNSKQGVLKALPNLLEDLIYSESPLKQLGIIVDADYQEKNGLGFNETLTRIKTIAADYGFTLRENNPHGFIFQYQNSEIQFGIWIMPNNQQEGMLEDFIKTCIHQNEQSLFDYATQTINNLPTPKFDTTIHLTKAKVATWLAWQKTPGHGFYATMTDNLLHTDHALFQELQNWLQKVFAA
jgi:hypothetical protein